MLKLNDKNPLFVYGTLRPDVKTKPPFAEALSIVAHAMCYATERGVLQGYGMYHTGAGYPFIKPNGKPSEMVVHGTILYFPNDEVFEGLLKILDDYEGVREGLYRRVKLLVNAKDADQIIESTVYVPVARHDPKHPLYEVIEHGDWKQFVGEDE